MGSFRQKAIAAAHSARRLIGATRGATAVEYGLIMALVVLTMIVALSQTAKVTVNMWNDTSNKVQAAAG
ncbi:MAG TPA: Flp family type IVb pilin [Sphingomonas sp.]|jgi:pilus assembly protein Flp/PilA|nr:Flp family type IVb pilin [Sphingomonas sp.]